MSKTPPQRRLSVRHGRKALGFTLLEVLVALLVLAFGFLAVAGIQLRALKTNFSSAQKSQATMLSYLILDAMRANRDQALAGDYNIDIAPPLHRAHGQHTGVGRPELLAAKGKSRTWSLDLCCHCLHHRGGLHRDSAMG